MDIKSKVEKSKDKVKKKSKMSSLNGKILLIAILIVLLMSSFSGCVKDYTKKDIRRYIIGQYGFDNFTVVEGPKEVEGEDGYTDLLWTLQTNTEDKIVFHVLDDRSWKLESVSNSLFTDFESVMLRYYAERYDGFENFKLDKEVKQGMEWNEIYATYKDRESLNEALDELNEFRDFVNSEGFEKELCMRYLLIFDNPIRYNVVENENEVEYEVDDGDEGGYVTSFDDKNRRDVEEEYLSTCIDYRFEQHLLDFTEKEIKDFVKQQKDQIGIDHENDGEYVYYDDLLASKYGYGVSFGTLFEILKREGFAVEGNVWHYSYIDEQGNKYDFSYDFVKKNPEDPEHKTWYYYLKNGETVWMDYCFYNHLHVNELEEITGLKFSIHRDDI